MRVALIFPNINQGKILKISFHPPLGLAYLAAVVENAKYEVSVIDAAALNLKNDELITRLKQINPDIIGVTTNILLSMDSLKLSQLLRRHFPDKKLVFGGPWASAVHKTLLKSKICDFVIVGEGEISFIELLRALEKNSFPERNPGVAYLDPADQSIHLEPPCPIEDLDHLPMPAWDLFPSPNHYFFHTRGRNFYPIMTSRGCPYLCNHCTKIIHGNKLRFRSIENVISEIRYLKERFSLDELLIIDDNFTLNKKRAEKICDEIIKEGFDILIQFSNGVRADTLTLKLLKKLKRAGTYKMAIGVESGNQIVVNKIGKRLNLDNVRRAAKLIKKEKIILLAFFMIGHPFDTVESMKDTINFALEIDPDYPHFFKAIAFPGTELYNQVKREGRFLMSVQDINRGYNIGSANFEIYDLKATDVELLFKQAYRRFYLRPQKMLSLLTKIRSFRELRYVLNYGLLTILNLLNLNR